MKDLKELTDYRQSPNASKIREIEATAQQILASQQETLGNFRTNLNSVIAKTDANIKAMRIAVSKSKQPGSINYRQSLPEPNEVISLESLLNSFEASEAQLYRVRGEADLVLNRERARWSQSPPNPPRTLADWFNTYGQPKRKRGPIERSLSLVCRPLTIVPGVRSIDGLVDFKTERSNCMNLRLGNLIQ